MWRHTLFPHNLSTNSSHFHCYQAWHCYYCYDIKTKGRVKSSSQKSSSLNRRTRWLINPFVRWNSRTWDSWADMMQKGRYIHTSVSCCTLSSTGDGGVSTGFPSGVTGVGLICFLSSLISFWTVLTRRHCHPKYPA